MRYLGVDIDEPLLRAALEGAAFRTGLALDSAGGRGTPWAVARSAAEQELRGISAEAPVIAIWDSRREDGGGDPFSHGLVRHLVSTDTLMQPHRVESWMVPLSNGGHILPHETFYREDTLTYESELDGPLARPSLEAAVVNDLARQDVDGRTSARVIKALVAITGLCEPETDGTRLNWPAYVQFGADLDHIWMTLTSPAVVRVESVVAEMSRGYRGLFRGRERKRIPALGWFFAFRQVDRLGIFLSPGETEIVATWDRNRATQAWQPELHLGVPGRFAWRRAVRHSVDWAGAVSTETLQRPARVRDVSALGAFVETEELQGFNEDEPVNLELHSPQGPIRIDGRIRYASSASVRPGLAIEFTEEARALGHELERLVLAA